MNYNEKRFNIVVKIASVIITFLHYVFWVLLVAGVIGLIGILFIPESNLLIIPAQLEQFPTHQFFVDSEEIFAFESIMLKPSLLWGTFNIALLSLGMIYGTKWIKASLKDSKDSKPFSDENVSRLFKLSYLIMVAGVVVPLLNSLFMNSLINNVTGSVFASEYADFHYSLDLRVIFGGLLIYILANIFAYGSYLQEEVDGTV